MSVMHFPKYATNDGVIDKAAAVLGDALIEAVDKVGEIQLHVKRESTVDVLRALRDTPGLEYQQLMEIAGVDYPSRGSERFEVVYCLLSLTQQPPPPCPCPHRRGRSPCRRRRCCGRTPAGSSAKSTIMFGVLFDGNPDLRRILTDYGFRGHPLRKDFPMTGYVELRYSEEAKRVVYEPVQLAQDFRSFDFLSPWEGAQYTLPGDEKAPQGARRA